MPYFRGVKRQRGRGLLTAAAAMGAARTIYPIAMPFLKKYVLPAAKRLGTSFVHNLLPEVAEVVRGKKKLSRGVKEAAKKAVKSQIGGGGGGGGIKKKSINNKKSKQHSRSSDNILKGIEF